MSRTDLKLTGVAAATSHLHDLQYQNRPRTSFIQDADADPELRGAPNETADKRNQSSYPIEETVIHSGINTDVPTTPEVDGAEQLKATFDEVKADLAAGYRPSSEVTRYPFMSPTPDSVRNGDSALPSRPQIIQSKVMDLDSRIAATKSQLDSSMRCVRNIATLTPFQKSTRDRLIVAVQSIAQRIVQVRLELAKLTCHRQVLLSDLASEEHSWKQTKAIALQAATETLRSRHPVKPPHLVLPTHVVPAPIHPSPAEPTLSPSNTRLAHQPESSICESFYSALDTGSDSLQPSHSRFLPDSETGSLNYSPRPSSSIRCSTEDTLGHSSYNSRSHPQFHSVNESLEEQAEEWDRTRCAQRVSLVRLPSEIQLETRFRRLGKHDARTVPP